MNDCCDREYDSYEFLVNKLAHQKSSIISWAFITMHHVSRIVFLTFLSSVSIFAAGASAVQNLNSKSSPAVHTDDAELQPVSVEFV